MKSLLSAAVDTCLSDTFSVSSSQSYQYPRLREHVTRVCHAAAKSAIDAAREQVEQHLDTEQSHPYTHDEDLLGRISKARHQSIRRDLELHLQLDQAGVVFDTQTMASILDGVWEKHTANPQMHMAQELEFVSASYGQVAAQRVLDRTTTLCWQVLRTLPGTLSDALGCITDELLDDCLAIGFLTAEKSSEP